MLHGRERFRRVHQVHGLRERFDGVDFHAFDDGRFLGIGLGHDQGANSLLAHAKRRGERAAHRAHAAVQRELAEENVTGKRLAEERSLAAENSQRHREIESRAFLFDVGRSEIHGDALRVGEVEPAIFDGGLDALAALLDGDIGQADDVEVAHASRADVHLDFDTVGVDSENGGAERFEEHE